MKQRRIFSSLLSLVLALAPSAFGHIRYVDGVNGSDTNNCKTRQTACKTIGHAISLASAGDTIGVGPATYTENLNITFNLKLIGSGASKTIIDGGGVNRVVTIYAGNIVTISNLTVRNGRGDSGGGIYNSGALNLLASVVTGNAARYSGGGGIYNTGTLLIDNSTLSGNGTGSDHPFEPGGGGIYNGGGATIIDSTLSGNQASVASGFCSNASGGGVYNVGSLTIRGSTLTGNSATSTHDPYCGYHSYGGGISNLGGGLTINNSTLNDNFAAGGHIGNGGAVYIGGGALTISNSTFGGNYSTSGGGINGTVTLQNTIVANSPKGGNCYGMMTSNGYNLSSDNTCTLNGPGDLNNTDPKLGPLQNNGGPTQTQALLPGSPAIDAGNPSGCTDGNGKLLTTDQRGAPRPDKEDTGGCDMGAFERQSD